MYKILDYYNENAESFFKTTYQVDMQSIYDVFLNNIPPQGVILDLGCGSGRDALAFKKMGYNVEATDNSLEMVKRAQYLTGLDIRVESFYDLSKQNKYDGIWACASLLHCKRDMLPDVLKRIMCALKNNGICYMSFKYGSQDREKDGRSFTDLNEHQLQRLLSELKDIHLLEQWVSLDKRPDKNEEWLNIIIQK